MEIFEFLFDAEGVNSAWYKKGKVHFQRLCSDYNRRASLIKDWQRRDAENKSIDVQEARNRSRHSDSLQVEGDENWRTVS
jgi:hypothetical protein